MTLLVCLKGKKLLFHEDNATCHKSIKAMAKQYEWFPHPPYSLDLDPSDYYLFTNLKNKININFACQKEIWLQ